jgi:hypothetical protein
METSSAITPSRPLASIADDAESNFYAKELRQFPVDMDFLAGVAICGLIGGIKDDSNSAGEL